MILKNISGGVESLPSINAISIAAGASIDLGQIVNGIPLAPDSKIQGDPNVYAGIASGVWAVVASGQELSLADSLAAITSANQATTATSILKPIAAVVLAKNELHTLVEVELALGEGVTIDITNSQLTFVRPGATDGGSICYIVKLGCVGYRRVLAGTEALRLESTDVSDESFKFESFATATAIGIRVRPTKSGGTLSGTLRVASEKETL